MQHLTHSWLIQVLYIINHQKLPQITENKQILQTKKAAI